METLFKYKTNESNFNEVKTAVEFEGEQKRVFLPYSLQVNRALLILILYPANKVEARSGPLMRASKIGQFVAEIHKLPSREFCSNRSRAAQAWVAPRGLR